LADITISSQVYRQQLIDLYYGDVREFATLDEVTHSAAFFVTLARENLDVYALCELFEDILLSKNDALTTCLPKFYELAREAAFGHMRAKMARELEMYFDQHTELCVEGYMNFRLFGAAQRVNNALYALIKKCLKFKECRIGEAYDNQ